MNGKKPHKIFVLVDVRILNSEQGEKKPKTKPIKKPYDSLLDLETRSRQFPESATNGFLPVTYYFWMRHGLH